MGKKDFKDTREYVGVEGGRKAYSLASKVKVASYTSQLCPGSSL